MTPAPDIRPPLDTAALAGLPAPFVVEVHEEVASTSLALAERARQGAGEGLVLAAEHQSQGRGRMGRAWVTAPRSALTFSVLLRPSVAPRRWPMLPLLTGLAVVEGIAATGGPPMALKWPNDVLSGDGLKVAGLLAERVDTPAGPAAVIGIGLNVWTTRAELPVPTAGSLLTAGMLDPDRSALLRHVLEAFAERYAHWAGQDEDAPLLEAYAARCDTIGREVEVRLPGERQLRGRATGLDAEGALLVQDEHGSHAVHAGDVVHVRVP